MRSIKTRLLIGLAASGMAGAAVLVVAVAFQYGLFDVQAFTTRPAQQEISEHVFLPLALFLGFFALGAFIVIRSVERKLQAFASEAIRSTQEMRPYQAPVDDLPTELQPFVSSLNALTRQLDLHARRQEAFASDAAHELKTPLALLTLELDRLDPVTRQPLLEQVRSLSNMIDQLLLLARCNASALGLTDTEIDPDSLVERIRDEFMATGLPENRSVRAEHAGAEPFRGLEEAVAAAVRTLVDNAVRATPSGGSVRILAGPGKSISVLDGGTGMSCESLATLKGRGVRADMASAGHTGLGLAIADRIVEAHGGEMRTCLPEASGIRLDFTRQI